MVVDNDWITMTSCLETRSIFHVKNKQFASKLTDSAQKPREWVLASWSALYRGLDGRPRAFLLYIVKKIKSKRAARWLGCARSDERGSESLWYPVAIDTLISSNRRLRRATWAELWRMVSYGIMGGRFGWYGWIWRREDAPVITTAAKLRRCTRQRV